ncbi:MAG: hypothetical protein PVJ51_07745, partial [Acidobacteriota bacterium]
MAAAKSKVPRGSAHAVRESVRKAIVHAAEAGEDVAKKIGSITSEAVGTALKKTSPTRAQIAEVSRNATHGVAEGATQAGIKAADLAKDAYNGVLEGVRNA